LVVLRVSPSPNMMIKSDAGRMALVKKSACMLGV
jgi:hypothetical protein